MISGCVISSSFFVSHIGLHGLFDLRYVGRYHIYRTGFEAEPNPEGPEPEREQAGHAGFSQHRGGFGASLHRFNTCLDR